MLLLYVVWSVFIVLLSNVGPSCAKTWIWQGALMPTSLRFSIKTDEDQTSGFRIVAATGDHRKLVFARVIGKVSRLNVERLRNERPFDEQVAFNESTAHAFHMVLEGLLPNTSYTWSATGEVHGRFRTPPVPGTPFNFTFAFASCADNDSDHTLFSVIPHNLDPLFMVHMGDLHYGNLVRNEVGAFASMFDRVLLRPNQAHLFNHMPVVYMWDDHDFGPNNADRYSPSRDAALEAFSKFVPSYPKGSLSSDGAVFFSFTMGRILFVVTDTSSARDPVAKTTLGHEQLEWLHHKLGLVARKPKEFAALVWVSTLPWIDDYFKWGEFAEERARIGAWIDDFALRDRMIIISGDAHMIAVDDGTHSVGRIKVFHAAALDAKPTTKGGPYSHGVWPGRNQYGTVEVRDLGDKICFRFQGWRWKRDKVLGRVVEFDTCDSSKNVPFLYRPSPLIVQQLWKRIKKALEQSEFPAALYLVTWIDSTRLTAHDFMEPAVFIPGFMLLLFSTSSLYGLLQATFQR